MGSLAIGYGRVSMSSDKTAGNSEEFQKAAVEAYCKANGLTLHNWGFDDGVSGATRLLERPAGRNIVDACTFKPATVVCYRVDRCFRFVEDFAVTCRQFREREIKLVSATEGFDLATSHGWFMGVMLVATAEYMRSSDNERRHASREERKCHGHRIAGEARYGWRFVDRGRRGVAGRVLLDVEPDPAEQTVIRRILGMVDNGVSLGAVAKRLNEEGVVTRRGGPWAKSMVERIVRDGRGRLAKAGGNPTEPEQPP